MNGSIYRQYEHRQENMHRHTSYHTPSHCEHPHSQPAASLGHLLRKLTNASVDSDIRLDLGSRVRSRNSSTREFGKQISVVLAESPRTSEGVCFTSAAESRAARRARISSKQLTSERRSLQRCLDILKNISLGENVAALANLESVA